MESILSKASALKGGDWGGRDDQWWRVEGHPNFFNNKIPTKRGGRKETDFRAAGGPGPGPGDSALREYGAKKLRVRRRGEPKNVENDSGNKRVALKTHLSIFGLVNIRGHLWEDSKRNHWREGAVTYSRPS